MRTKGEIGSNLEANERKAMAALEAANGSRYEARRRLHGNSPPRVPEEARQHGRHKTLVNGGALT